jgi:hypothetical protein
MMSSHLHGRDSQVQVPAVRLSARAVLAVSANLLRAKYSGLLQRTCRLITHHSYLPPAIVGGSVPRQAAERHTVHIYAPKVHKFCLETDFSSRVPA